MTAVGSRTFSAMRYRNFRRYIVGQGISYVGSWMQFVAQGWLADPVPTSTT